MMMAALGACETGPRTRKQLPPRAREPAAIRSALDLGWLTETDGAYAITEKGVRALEGHRRMRANVGD